MDINGNALQQAGDTNYGLDDITVSGRVVKLTSN
jgi:hypothetical protein